MTDAVSDASTSYFYDEIYRLLNVVSLSPENFTYDDVGNRKSGPGPADIGPYLHNDANQVTTGRNIQYGYDDRGNQTTRTVSNTTGKTWTLSWDYENRLKTVEKTKTMPDGTESKTVNFTYDPFGRRVGRTVERTYYDVHTSQYVTKTESYAYVYDNEDIVLELYTPSSGPVEKTYYTHGPGVDEPLALERGGLFYYYHADGLGSIVAITDSSHNSIQSYKYESFGMSTQTTSFRNNYQFAAREYDPETGLYFNRARYYDPMEGRFVQKDPLSFAGGDVNLYQYVSANPINWIDPDGLEIMSPGYSYPSYAHDNEPESLSCVEKCILDQLGITTLLGAAGAALGAPILSASGKLGGATEGTSIASKFLSSRFPQRIGSTWAPTLGNPFARSAVLGRVLGRWVPIVGWGLLAYDAIKIGACTDKCMKDNECK